MCHIHHEGAVQKVLVFEIRNFLILLNIIAFLVGLIIQINDLTLLFACRVIQGFIIGNYMAITPIYVN